MPKFIGSDPPKNSTPLTGTSFRATWSQVVVARRNGETRLDYQVVATDKGGPRQLAKRWYAWFLPVEVALQPWATKSMKKRSGVSPSV